MMVVCGENELLMEGREGRKKEKKKMKNREKEGWMDKEGGSTGGESVRKRGRGKKKKGGREGRGKQRI